MTNFFFVFCSFFRKTGKKKLNDEITDANRPDCEAQVKGFTGAIYKKFKTQAEANEFIEQKRSNSTLLSTVSHSSNGSVTVMYKK